MSQEIKNRVDSIRRTLKAKGIYLKASQIEMTILDLFPNIQDWSSDARLEVIKTLSKQELNQCPTFTPMLNLDSTRKVSKV